MEAGEEVVSAETRESTSPGAPDSDHKSRREVTCGQRSVGKTSKEVHVVQEGEGRVPES